MKVVFVVMLICTTLFAQTSKEMRQKYGAPVAESYLVRPGILVTTTFAKSGEICEMLIEPQRAWTPIKSGTKKLNRKELDGIVDELVSPSQRGRGIIGGFVNMRCLPDDDCWGSSATYEKVFIYYNVGGKDEYRYATIQWKEGACRR